MSDTAVVYSILAKDNASGVMGKIGGAAKTMLAGFAATEIVGQVHDAINAASDLNESVSKSQVIFGAGSAAVSKWADNAAAGFGESKQQAIEAAATFGNFFEAMGIGAPKAQTMSTNMVQLAGDLASFNNADPAQVLEDIRSGLSGQVEPLRKYGVDLSDVTLKHEALALGLVKADKKTHEFTGTLTAGQKAQAAYALITSQTKTAQGDFSRTSGGLANQQRILAADFENVKAKVGAGLLPVMTKLAGAFINVLGFVEKNSSWLGPLAIGLGFLAAGVWAVTAAQTAWNVVMALNPIGLIIIAVIALVAVIIYLWTHSAAFRNFFIGLWNDIWGFLKAVGAWFAGPFAGFFVTAWHDITGGFQLAVSWIRGGWNAMISFVTGIPGRISNAARGMWDGIKDAFRSAVNWLIGKWNGLQFKIPSVSFMGVSTPSFTLGVPKIPYLASGGVATRGGLAMVGERGAEVVSLPAGAAVYPHGSGPGGGPAEMRISGNADGAFATALKQMVRTGQITFYDSTGQAVTVT